MHKVGQIREFPRVRRVIHTAKLACLGLRRAIHAQNWPDSGISKSQAGIHTAKIACLGLRQAIHAQKWSESLRVKQATYRN